MGFKSKFKKLRKALHVPALTVGNAVKAGGIIATGGIGALPTAIVASKLKSAAIGGIKQAIKAKAQKTLAKKLSKLAPSIARSTPAAVTMPGGAPLKAAARAAVGSVKRRAKKAVARAVTKATRGARKAAGGKRTPPKGGKDFKALSASWKAAGKPGTWIEWVKSH